MSGSKKKHAARFLSAALLLCMSTSYAFALPQIGGHFKSLNIYTQAPPASPLSSGEISSNRLRLDISDTLATRGRWEISIENILLYTDPAGLVPLPSDSPNQHFDLEKDWNRDGRFADRLFVDRLNFKTTLHSIEIAIGRQAIGFGRINLFSPLDVIAPFPPDALDTEVRPGIDALRFSRYFGRVGQFSAMAVLGDKSEHNSYLATLEGNMPGIDLLGITGSLRKRSMAGFGLASQIAGMGIKGEIAWYDGRDEGKTGEDLHGDFAIGGIEADYRFENDVTLFLQYLYNGAGVKEAEDYPNAALSAPFQEGLSFLAGRHYLLAAPAYELHPLVTASGLLIWNLKDDSFLLRPLLDISLSDDLDLQVFWNINHGEKPDKNPLLGIGTPRSEFGSLGDSGGIFLKYFF